MAPSAQDSAADSPAPQRSTESSQSLAQKLVVELMSYQFASPVRWIETQNILFNEKKPIQRYVEIGPSTVLTTMAKKTASQHYRSQPASRWSHLQFLSYNGNKDSIYYDYAEDTETEDASSTPEVVTAPQPVVPAVVAVVPVPAAAVATQAVADIPLSASHIVISMTAQKLRKGFDQISAEKTIAQLAGGKSTLQNELIGDLEAEFGHLPDGAEGFTLSSLAEALQDGFSSKLGKPMSSLLSRLVSSKMPAGFNQAAIQEYLLSHWGLSKQHSLIPLCFATTIEPPSRLPNIDRAKEFLNDLISRYAAFASIQLTPGGGGSGVANAPTASLVDMSGVETMKKDLQNEQLQVMARLFGVGDAIGDERYTALEASESELIEKLDRWNAEFDESFFQGIQPAFEARHERTYKSWWNWAREDVRRLCSEIALGLDSNSKDRVQHLLNKWDPSCTEIIRAFIGEKSPTLSPAQRGRIEDLARLASGVEKTDPKFQYSLPSLAPQTTISDSGNIEYREVARRNSDYVDVIRQGSKNKNGESVPFVHLRQQRGDQWEYEPESTALYLNVLDSGAKSGLTYAGKTVLVTGAGQGSIGAEVVRALLCGGARVILTTSKGVSSTASFYQNMYYKYGARGSSLTVFPFNQASKADCAALIKHLYETLFTVSTGDLDYILPFAAIPDAGALDNIDGKSEIAHRAMLINLLRLLGYIRAEKERKGINTKPTTVILPLSPNHGTFGGDGLYSETKLGLETLFNRFHSEDWSDYLTICGAVIGWTRGTGLMTHNNVVAEAIERLNTVITFSQQEMAFNILALMTPEISALCDEGPVYADLAGGLQTVDDLKNELTTARNQLSEASQLRKALSAEDAHEQVVLNGPAALGTTKIANLPRPQQQRANLNLKFPSLPDYQSVTDHLRNLTGTIDLSRTVVVVGYSELGPWGSSRTRWEMEHQGDLTLEGYLELAWIMGLVKYVDGELKGQPYVGWVDTETQQPIKEEDISQKYGATIREHSGLRFIEPHGLGGFDPSKKEFAHEVVIEEDLPPFECPRSTAEAFKLQHGSNVAIQPVKDSPEDYTVQVKKGACFLVPKAGSSNSTVGGHLPKGWDPKRYGIPEEIIQQVEPITLYALCCVSEAMLSAGIQDPYELYSHMHVSELANCLGTCFGGFRAARAIYKDRYLDRPVANDVLQEYFLNTMGAWINMLMLSATGPIKTPAGACATAIESLDLGCAAIQSGQCKAAIVGGSDDLHEEVSYEFRNMKATADNIDELAKGRLPKEMSRPSTTSRSGFIEAAGCGTQLIMSADLALEMGLPVYGIVAYTQMAGDQIGRSVPAPGKGIMTAAREAEDARDSSLLSLEYRQRRLKEDLTGIQRWRQDQIAEVRYHPTDSQRLMREINAAAMAKLKAAQNMWSNDIRAQQPSIAPVKAALATWGLTVDDIQVASMHGTSTKANDINEADVIYHQMTHMGRGKGNPLLAVCQKSLTGHPKGAAGAWQLNGCIQIMQSGVVPGNHNADDIDEKLRQYEHIVYLNKKIQLPEVKATMITSFGFGQKSAIAMIVNPKYLFAATTEAAFSEYRARATQRQRVANIAFKKRVCKNTILQPKAHSAWGSSPAALRDVFFDPVLIGIDTQTVGCMIGDPPYDVRYVHTCFLVPPVQFAELRGVTAALLALGGFVLTRETYECGTIIPTLGATAVQRVEENDQAVELSVEENVKLESTLRSFDVVGERQIVGRSPDLWG
ncbi:hypothetical protein BBP40_007638 [Aspergillus hancockii]|nr:hypothetical protein BBP40_007638 [Aspergillus hancockii]